MTRRELLTSFAFGTLGLIGSSAFGLRFPQDAKAANAKPFEGKDVFDRLIGLATAGNWAALPIGELMGKIAKEFEGTPYVGFTLELDKDREFPVINLKGLDCVTFFEDTLDFARMLKKGGRTPDDMLAEIALTRYRGGQPGDFSSRLHYTTDWFVDNEKKGVVKILTPELPGAQPFTQKVGIMTEHPENYRQLAAHPELVEKIRGFEGEINGRSLKYLPMDRIEGAESMLQTGDIVGVATTQSGIDIAHTGLIYKDAAGLVHFMDASSAKSRMKVTIEPEISKCLNWSKRLTGIMIARPLEPK